MVFRRGITLIVAGLFLGLLGSVASTRLIRHLLFNVGPTDLPTLSGVSLFVGAVALVGCLVPTWRAVRMDPIVAFRAK
jgi:ABC-type antimicrobial peptide transport system permease subunit